MAFNVYRWTDTSAPVLTGQVGSLITLLDACLVNGYGSMSAAGWTKPYTSTNAADYLQGGSSNQRYFQIDDNGPGAGAAREARLSGYEAMTAYSTGTNSLANAPMIAGTPSFMVIRKSATADATVREWIVAADNRTVYGFVHTGDVAAAYFSFWFGDFYSNKSSDPWKAGISARSSENSSSQGSELLLFLTWGTITTLSNCGTIFRNAAAVATPLAIQCVGDSVLSGLSTTGSPVGVLSYPHSPDGGFYLAPIHIVENNAVLRGRHRGIWHVCHPASVFNDGDTVAGTGPYAGRNFQIIKNSGPSTGYCALETTAWPSSS